MNKIFIVEDDSVIATEVAAHLTKWDMEVARVKDFRRVAEEVAEAAPDLVLLDIKLPYFNGFYWCTEIRKTMQIPIVFLSSADDNMNIVMAMNMGGDDFISKPFDLNVLTAKLQAILRRSYGMELARHTLTVDDVVLDLESTVLSRGEQKQSLTKNEFLILKALMEKKGSVVTREELMERLWGNDEFVDDNTLTVNVTRIRRKLEELGRGEMVQTKRGLGYIIE